MPDTQYGTGTLHSDGSVDLNDVVVAKPKVPAATARQTNASFVERRGLLPPLDGITEVWIADPSASSASEDAAKASAELVEDEKRFVEMGKSRCFMTKEHVIFDHT